jgi:hypothetical protein
VLPLTGGRRISPSPQGFHRCRRGRQRAGRRLRHEIGLGAGITDSAADFACGNIERGDQGFGTVPDILELAPLDMSRLHRQARGGTFQRLDAGHFVDRNSLHVLLGGGGGGLIHRADIGALGVEVRIGLGR